VLVGKHKKKILILRLEFVKMGRYDCPQPRDGARNSHLYFKRPSVDTEFDTPGLQYISILIRLLFPFSGCHTYRMISNDDLGMIFKYKVATCFNMGLLPKNLNGGIEKTIRIQTG
jgi:hypothetical protein